MVRRGLLVLAMLLVVSFTAYAVDAPRITVAEQRYDFGTVSAGTVLEHVFEIKNTGQTVLEIQKVQPS